MNIDIVITWVDGENSNWQKQRKKYEPLRPSINTEIRYRDYGTFKYVFRSIEKFAPWVHRIYIVTSGESPSWLNVESDKIVLIKHDDYMPKTFLPTFSSNPIEINLHRIKELSEYFILFNDDMFLLNQTKIDDFFHKSYPRSLGVYSPITPYREFSDVVFNNVRLINRHFDKFIDIRNNWNKIFNLHYGIDNFRTAMTLPWKHILGYKDMHLPMAHLKSTMEKVWQMESIELTRTSENKFRTVADINHWVFNYWNIEEGKFYPQKRNFGKYVTLNDFDKVEKVLHKSKYKTICINDDYNVTDYAVKMKRLIELFEEKFPEKSQFEK